MAPLVEVSRVTALEAAALLAGIEGRDPRGIMRAGDVLGRCERGQCFAATEQGSGSQAVYVLRVERGQAWVDACKGIGAVDFTRTLLPIIELQARELESVAFQTARRGLVRKAEKQGYRVTGYIMRKDLRP